MSAKIAFDAGELDVTQYTISRVGDSALDDFRQYVKYERLFEKVPKNLNNDGLLRLVDDFTFLKKILVVEGCRHQCTFCFYSPSSNVTDMFFDDYSYVVEKLEEIARVARLSPYYRQSEFALHRNGEAIMHVGQKNPSDGAKGWLPAMVEMVRDFQFLDRNEPRQNKVLIYTAGFYDIDPERTITKNVSTLVSDPARYFGGTYNSKGGIMFSLHTAPKYYRHLEPDRGITKKEWVNHLIENFRLLMPLYEDGRLVVRIKTVDNTPRNTRMLNNYPPSYSFKLLEDILKGAGYPKLDVAVAEQPSFLFVGPAFNLGGGKKFDNVPSYAEFNSEALSSVESMSQLRKGNPSVYIGIDGKLVRTVPKLLRDHIPEWTIRTTQLSLPSQWRRLK